jgi:nicotinate phosphoribosyltransferase
LRAFRKKIPQAAPGPGSPVPSTTEPPVKPGSRTYAEVFTGVRQDSGDPLNFIKMMREFYYQESITDKKTVVFSDSLNVELCLKYKAEAEAQGLQPTFGVGTFLTSKMNLYCTLSAPTNSRQTTSFRSRRARSLSR